MATNVFVGPTTERFCPPRPVQQRMSRESPLDGCLDLSRVESVQALHDVTLREISNEPDTRLARSGVSTNSNLYQSAHLVDNYIEIHV